MTDNFDINRIVKYLNVFKDELPTLYSWEISDKVFDKLEELNIYTDCYLKKSKLYEKTIYLKFLLFIKLTESKENHNKVQFKNLCKIIINDWGGIKSSKVDNTDYIIDKIYNANLNKNIELPFKRIASSSKILSFLNPQKYVIYDSRITYSLNWILLVQQAGDKYFPMPEGRNSKLQAFDISVLIRLLNVSKYKVADQDHIKRKNFISDVDKEIFINKKNAYTTYNKLILDINKKLWTENSKQKYPFYTEMLLFSLADTKIFNDITNKKYNF